MAGGRGIKAAGVAAVLWTAVAGGAVAQTLAPDLTPSAPPDRRADPRPDAPVQALVRWATQGGDAAGRPFAVVDKPQARIHVYDASGRRVGSDAVLLGLARGDDSAPGVGERVSTGLAPQERTTPAGRFDSQPGHNHRGEAIVWVDYDAAIAIHRLRPGPAAERRPQRLASATVDDNRISLGCIVVSEAFYDAVVGPVLGRQRGVVYVLPDTRAWTEVFAAARAD